MILFLPLRLAGFSDCYQTTVLRNRTGKKKQAHHCLPMKDKLRAGRSVSGEDLNITSRTLRPYIFLHEVTEYSTGTETRRPRYQNTQTWLKMSFSLH